MSDAGSNKGKIIVGCVIAGLVVVGGIVTWVILRGHTKKKSPDAPWGPNYGNGPFGPAHPKPNADETYWQCVNGTCSQAGPKDTYCKNAKQTSGNDAQTFGCWKADSTCGNSCNAATFECAKNAVSNDDNCKQDNPAGSGYKWSCNVATDGGTGGKPYKTSECLGADGNAECGISPPPGCDVGTFTPKGIVTAFNESNPEMTSEQCKNLDQAVCHERRSTADNNGQCVDPETTKDGYTKQGVTWLWVDAIKDKDSGCGKACCSPDYSKMIEIPEKLGGCARLNLEATTVCDGCALDPNNKPDPLPSVYTSGNTGNVGLYYETRTKQGHKIKFPCFWLPCSSQDCTKQMNVLWENSDKNTRTVVMGDDKTIFPKEMPTKPSTGASKAEGASKETWLWSVFLLVVLGLSVFAGFAFAKMRVVGFFYLN